MAGSQKAGERLTRADRQSIALNPLLSVMPKGARERLVASGHLRALAAETGLFRLGDRADHVHVVLSGGVKLLRSGAGGQSAVIAVLEAGQAFGEAPALLGAAYPVSAETIGETRLLAIPGGALLDMMQAERDVLAAVLSMLFAHLHHLVDDLEAMKTWTARERLAAFLLGRAGETDQGLTLRLPYDKVLLAARLGMTPESLSRAFHALREHGVSTSGHHVSIDAPERLRAMLDPG